MHANKVSVGYAFINFQLVSLPSRSLSDSMLTLRQPEDICCVRRLIREVVVLLLTIHPVR